jgi:hypothetical protein
MEQLILVDLHNKSCTHFAQKPKETMLGLPQIQMHGNAHNDHIFIYVHNLWAKWVLNQNLKVKRKIDLSSHMNII